MSTQLFVDLRQQLLKQTASPISLLKKAAIPGVYGAIIYYDMLNPAFPLDKMTELVHFCHQKNFALFVDPENLDTLAYLNALQVNGWYVSPQNTDFAPLLIGMGESALPVLIDTSLSDLTAIRQCTQLIQKFGGNHITLLHGNPYAQSVDQINLRTMVSLKGNFQVHVGFMDTLLHPDMCIVAATLGAEAVTTALGPNFHQNIQRIQQTEQLLGSSSKQLSQLQITTRASLQKRLAASRPIQKGHIITEGDISAIYSQNPEGLTPLYWYDCLDKPADTDYTTGQLFHSTLAEDKGEE